MATRVTIKTVGSNNFVRTQTLFVKRLSERQIKEIALETERVMKQNVADSITRANSTGNLENSIFAEKIPGGWGVGNIDFLNLNANYWRHINFGSVAIGASHSHRVPSGAFQPGNTAPTPNGSGQRWGVGSGDFSFIPGKPIAPRHYIEKTLQRKNSIVNDVLRRVN